MGIGPQDRIDKFRPEPRAHRQGGDHRVARTRDVKHLLGLRAHMAGTLVVKQAHALFAAGDDHRLQAQLLAQVLRFVTKTEDEVEADADHPITVRLTKDEPAPYIHVRAGLNALIDRKCFYRMIELGCHEVQQDGQSWFGLWSKGQFFKLIPSADLS